MHRVQHMQFEAETHMKARQAGLLPSNATTPVPTSQLLHTALRQLSLAILPLAHLPQSAQISAIRQLCCIYFLQENEDEHAVMSA